MDKKFQGTHYAFFSGVHYQLFPPCLVNKIISVSSDKYLLLMTPWQLCFVFSLVSHFLPTTFVFPSINYASVLIKLNSPTGICVITLTSRGDILHNFQLKL